MRHQAIKANGGAKAYFHAVLNLCRPIAPSRKCYRCILYNRPVGPHRPSAKCGEREKSLAQCAGRDSSVGIATGYGMHGPRIESRWMIFRTPPDRLWGPPSLLHNGYRVFPEGKAAGAWRFPPTLCRADVKERVKLQHQYPLWPFLTCSRTKLLVTLLGIEQKFLGHPVPIRH